MIMSGKETDLKTMEKHNIIVIITQDMLQSERADIKHLRDLTWVLFLLMYIKNCCIMDEVHGLPAKQVSKAFGELKTHMKIGLTATPFRVIIINMTSKITKSVRYFIKLGLNFMNQ